MTDHRLFDDRRDLGSERAVATRRRRGRDAARATRTRWSALWAAYGDALGFISELTDAAGLRRRTRGRDLTEPLEWKRRIGGRGGVNVMLPTGCYSDDTQLRLATARAISSTGFDVEAFAKVELPVWPAYALGGGLSTKAAASNLAKPTTAWFSNAYDGWLDAGGNGAAMRIQPHVWAARDPADPSSYLLDVVRNAVCSHAHPTALVGAVLHSLALAHSIVTGSLPEPAILNKLLDHAATVPTVLQGDSELAELWLAGWEREAVQSFADAWRNACTDAGDAISVAERAVTGSLSPAEKYGRVTADLNLLDPSCRGSGILTAIAAAALTWCDDQPARSLAIAANVVGSDTDTIATMAGALLGAIAHDELPVPVLDHELILAEADRLTDIAFGQAQHGHRYPDLLTWSAPKTQADALLRGQDSFHVAGLGPVRRVIGDPLPAPQGPFQWQWAELTFGQTVLIKSRDQIPAIPHSDSPSQKTRKSRSRLREDREMQLASDDRTASEQVGLDQPDTGSLNQRPSAQTPAGRKRPLDIARVIEFVEREQSNDTAIGYAIRRVANEATPEQTASFLSVLLRLLQHPTARD